MQKSKIWGTSSSLRHWCLHRLFGEKGRRMVNEGLPGAPKHLPGEMLDSVLDPTLDQH